MCIDCVPDKVLKETLDKVLLSGYFDRVHTHQNGAVCEEVEEGEEESQIVEEEEPKAEEPPSEPGNHHETTTECDGLAFPQRSIPVAYHGMCFKYNGLGPICYNVLRMTAIGTALVAMDSTMAT